MKKQWLVTALVVVSMALVAFLNGLGGEFILDDSAFLVGNPHLDTPHNLAYFFTKNLWYYSNIPDAYSASYRPLFFLFLWLSNQLSLANPLALHLLVLQLHMLATLLLLLTIRRMVPGISPLAAGIAAGLFAVHPVHSEAVAWISAFIHPLTTVFLLAAYLAHDKAHRNGGIMATVGALAFFILALLSNEMAVAFPFFILLNDRLRYGRLYFSKNAPYLVLLITYALVRNLILGEPVPLTFLDLGSWLQFPVFLLEYLRHLLLPWPQPLFLQMPDDWKLSVGALLTLTLYLAALVGLGRIPIENRKIPLIATAWVAAFLLPPLAAAFSPDARFALRSLYLPSIGISILLAWAIDTLPTIRRPLGITLVGFTLILALAGTVAANRHWINDGAVYSNIILWNPSHQAGYLGLGKFFERNGEAAQALALYERSISLAEPSEKVESLEHMALLLGESGDNARSLELYKQLTVLKPDSAFVWTGVGNNLWALGQIESAADAYLQAYKADPDNRVTCHNLVLTLNQLGQTAEAARYVECAKEKH